MGTWNCEIDLSGCHKGTRWCNLRVAQFLRSKVRDSLQQTVACALHSQCTDRLGTVESRDHRDDVLWVFINLERKRGREREREGKGSGGGM